MESPQRGLRQDAQRNRDRILAVAQVAFSTGADGEVSLESIARDAQVGIGTLYRHFPTRESLVEAVYATELDDVVLSARALLGQLPPDAALRSWMSRYADFIGTKRGMMSTLRSGWASGRLSTSTTRERITGAIATILDAGAKAGVLRADVEADDVTTLLLGTFLSAGSPTGRPERIEFLIDLVVDAVRPQARG